MTLREYLLQEERDYKDEYKKFQNSDKEKKNRALRNNAKRNSKCIKGDEKEIDHIIPLSKNGTNNKNNQRIVTRHINRIKGKK